MRLVATELSAVRRVSSKEPSSSLSNEAVELTKVSRDRWRIFLLRRSISGSWPMLLRGAACRLTVKIPCWSERIRSFPGFWRRAP